MELQEILAISFNKDQKIRLAPFIAALAVYFILYLPVFDYPLVTFGAVFFKVLPIWCLALYVFLADGGYSLHKLPPLDNLIPGDEYARHIFCGLLISSLGDACLIWRQVLFVPGVLCFGIAHVVYYSGFQVKGTESRTQGLFFLLGLGVFLFLQPGIDSIFMKVIIALYIYLIFCVGWKATARFEETKTKAVAVGCIGALLFIFSDFLIATDKWYMHLPLSQGLIMTSYYGAQFGLALSTTKDLV